MGIITIYKFFKYWSGFGGYQYFMEKNQCFIVNLLSCSKPVKLYSQVGHRGSIVSSL